jgi:hypothetical protein
VRKLRQKLRIASPEWNYIHTHFGVGYRFAPEVENGHVVDSPHELVEETEFDSAFTS